MGRPTVRNDDVENEIVLRLSKGEPMASICRDDHMPSVSTVRNWQNDDETFSASIARAREDGFDAIAADCLEIADATGNDTRIGQDGSEQPNSEWITRSRLRVDTRLKLLAKWDPKRYGEKTLVGSDPENPLPTGFAVTLVKGSGEG